MSEPPESYFHPVLLPLRPCDIGDLTPEMLLYTFNFCEQRGRHGAV